MYGKLFQSLYKGSMIGAGPVAFAVWGYVVAETQKGRVELNPHLLAMILGCTDVEIERAIDYLSQPDTKSRNKDYEGRRLVREGEYQYLVPSWENYNKIRSAEELREYNRLAQQRHREKAKEIKDRSQ